MAHWRERVCMLKVGGSFDVTTGDIATIQRVILNAAKSVGIPVTTRKLKAGGLRVWRVK